MTSANKWLEIINFLPQLTAKFTSSLAASFDTFKTIFPFPLEGYSFQKAIKILQELERTFEFQHYYSQTRYELWLENENWICWFKWDLATLVPFFAPAGKHYFIDMSLKYYATEDFVFIILITHF